MKEAEVAKAAWNVLVFLNAKNNLEIFSFDNFLQMAAVGSTPEVNILVEYGRPKNRPGGEPAGYSTAHGGWSTTLRFHVKKGDAPIESKALANVGRTNMGEGASLAAFLTWTRETYPAEHTLLVIWDHGQGWRVEVDGSTTTVSPPGYRYVSHDEDFDNNLFNREIQDTLTNLGGGIDVIAFDACLMAMLETAYAFREVSRILVGSEELEPGTGWNYTRWLEPLVQRKGVVTPAELGELIVDAMRAEYEDLSKTTLSAIDLARVDDLARSLSDFANAATAYLNHGTLKHIKTARFACKNYAPGMNLHSIDLARFMDQIVAGGASEEIKAKAAEVRKQIGSAVVANYASKLRQDKYGSHGIAIYFPGSYAAYRSDPDRDGYEAGNTKFPVEFVEREAWATFLRRYWELVP
jgi:hypothetical protein